MKGPRRLRSFIAVVTFADGCVTPQFTVDAVTPEAAIVEAKRRFPDWQSVRVIATGRSLREWLVARAVPEADVRIDLGAAEAGGR